MKPTLLLALCCVVLAACGNNDEQLARIQGELAAQAARVEESERRQLLDRKQLLDELAALRRQLEQSQPAGQPQRAQASETDQLAKCLTAIDQKLDAILEQAVAAAREEAARVAAPAIDNDAVAEMAATKLAADQAANAPTKNLEQAFERLTAGDADKQRVRAAIIDAKRRILETLEMPTADGRVLAVELVDAIIAQHSGTGTQAELQRLFGTLATTKLPGDASGRTYLEVINDIKHANREAIGTILSEEDRRKLKRAHEDWTDFEVGEDDPWAALYLQRLESSGG